MSTQNLGCAVRRDPNEWSHKAHSTPFQVDMIRMLIWTSSPHRDA